MKQKDETSVSDESYGDDKTEEEGNGANEDEKNSEEINDVVDEGEKTSQDKVKDESKDKEEKPKEVDLTERAIIMDLGSDDEDEKVGELRSQSECIVYEWEEELEEYDEPDIYPSEKDYKWFEDTVTDSEEEEEEMAPEVPEKSEEIVVQEEQTEAEQPTEEKTEATEEAETEKKESEETEEEDEEHFVPTVISEVEEEVEEAPKKKYKTIMVRRLVERPPKIHHDVDKIRVDEQTDAPTQYYSKPFRFVHSFGYDCQRLANLIVLDNTTLLFMSGFVLTFYDHKTHAKSYLRTLGGGSFGAIHLHPSRKLFAAAEKGVKPMIGIWSWPKIRLFRKLEDGTGKTYASVNFSPDGKLLASQGGEPDYLITVWNWLAQTPVLRVKSHVQDVYRVTFAKELAGLLTTSGLCHIKFWKMARTFTGLKLKGDVGRFGRTELTDIEGYVEMVDGKVLSGTEWGNLLVWENGLVIAELGLSNGVPCHAGIVRQIRIVEGDFFSTGQDGRIKVWGYDEVDTAEIHTGKDNLRVTIKPLADVVIRDDADIWSIFQDPYNNDENSIFWFAQDGAGYIWQVDLSFLHVAKEPKIVHTAHGGAIIAGVTSSFDYMFATLGNDGKVIIHDYMTKQMLAMRIFSAPGTCMIWPGQEAVPDGCMIIAGFSDGVLRVLTLSGKKGSDGLPYSIIIRRVWKPHHRKITSVCLDRNGEFLVTGSEDGTIFFFDATNDFKPMIQIASPQYLPVLKTLWVPADIGDTERMVIVTCQGALVQEIEMPMPGEFDNSTSYHYLDAKYHRNCHLKSIKSVLRHNEELARKQQHEEERQASIEKHNQKLIEQGIETEAEQDARLLEEAEEEEKMRNEQMNSEKKWEPYIPPTPSDILDIVPDNFDGDVFHVSLDGYDAGYIYSIRILLNDIQNEMECGGEEPFNAIPVVDSDDEPVSKMLFINGGNNIMMGFLDGRIRITRVVSPYDLGSLSGHWTFGTHDIVRGCITSISLDKEEDYLFTTGMDGNCFMHSFIDHEKSIQPRTDIPVIEQSADIHDIVYHDAYTLEDSKNVEKERAKLEAARKNKIAKKDKISHLRYKFQDILNRNNELPTEIRLTAAELCLVTDGAARKKERFDLAHEELRKEMAWQCEHDRLAFEKVKAFFIDIVEYELFALKAFNSDNKVFSYRLSKFPDFFEDAKRKQATAERFMTSLYEATDDDESTTIKLSAELEKRPKRKHGMDKFVHQKLIRIWQRRQKKLIREREWDIFLRTDPSGHELEDDMEHIHEARLNMGDMKLKMDPNYKVPDEKKLTVSRARKRLIKLEEEMHDLKENFNNKLIDLRDNKVKVLSRINEFVSAIKQHQIHLPVSMHLNVLEVPDMTMEEDPDAIMRYNKEDVAQYQQKLKTQAMGAWGEAKGALKKIDTAAKRAKKNAAPVVEKTPEVRIISEDIELGCHVENITPIPSQLELEIKKRNEVKATFYQKYYQECIAEEKIKFDAKLKLMKHDKTKLDYDLKIAEARMIILTEEFILAEKSVEMEANLESSVKEATKEKKVCTIALKGLQKSADTLKKELDKLAAKRNELLKEVQDIATNAPNFEKYLIRVFRKKITLKKEKTKSEDEFEDEESSESEDSDDDAMDLEEEEEEDDGGLDVDFPPSDLKTEIYDAVVEVRNRRLGLDQVEVVSRTKLDEVTVQMNGFRSRIQAAENTFQQTKSNLDKFNLEKQSKLNCINDTVNLNLHQIMYMTTDLDEALVTTKTAIKCLRDRIPELKKEKNAEKKRVHTTKREYYRLGQDDKKFQQRVDDMDKMCDNEMLIKFGKVKPVSELENFQEHPDLIRARKELAQQQKYGYTVLYNLDEELLAVIGQHCKLAIDQTHKMNTMVEMKVELNAITKAMDDDLGQAPMEVEDIKMAKELAALTELIQKQTKVIESLKREIFFLSSRHVKPLPPIPPNN